MAGGPLETPGSLVHVGLLTEVANPLKLGLAWKFPLWTCAAHCAPQNV
jgi:hypothetical protein